MTTRPVTARPVLTRPVLNGKEAPVSRYRRWNELLATSGQLQVQDAAGIAADDRARLEDEGVEVVLA
jgi:hypothetical protein